MCPSLNLSALQPVWLSAILSFLSIIQPVCPDRRIALPFKLSVLVSVFPSTFLPLFLPVLPCVFLPVRPSTCAFFTCLYYLYILPICSSVCLYFYLFVIQPIIPLICPIGLSVKLPILIPVCPNSVFFNRSVLFNLYVLLPVCPHQPFFALSFNQPLLLPAYSPTYLTYLILPGCPSTCLSFTGLSFNLPLLPVSPSTRLSFTGMSFNLPLLLPVCPLTCPSNLSVLPASPLPSCPSTCPSYRPLLYRPVFLPAPPTGLSFNLTLLYPPVLYRHVFHSASPLTCLSYHSVLPASPLPACPSICLSFCRSVLQNASSTGLSYLPFVYRPVK